MEAIFNATPKNRRLVFDNMFDIEAYCIEQENIEQVISIKPLAKTSEKMRMYAYLFGPLMDCAVQALTDAGWPGMDKVKSRYIMQAEFGKEEMVNPDGVVEPYLIPLEKMSKPRLLKFIKDIIFELESKYNQSCPDSQTYKMMQLTGRNFKSTKFKKDE